MFNNPGILPYFASLGISLMEITNASGQSKWVAQIIIVHYYYYHYYYHMIMFFICHLHPRDCHHHY